ncbi:carbon catabolite repressor protein 4 homolog 5 isoform X2 [Macadamia integrifolia]|uniref:carbon catabolite repressor protein 4 homolog 5 isoform X2 n=1 Tax=Macadamia integrifolia TaxID=60698 RepID=UPI001C52C2CB|nr:carbon catabolite repressor protein 4 homolog 5 isoform X2 [Macadamia integrifolia]
MESSPRTLGRGKREPPSLIEQTHQTHSRKRRRVVTVESEIHVHEKRYEISSSNSRRGGSSSPWIDERQRKKNKRRQRSKKEFVDGYRKWVFSPHDFSRYKDRVCIVSYNILGVENALKHPYLYPQVRPQFLNWDWRKKLILKELNHYEPGILCFQEVDRYSDLADLLQKDGFKGVYKVRTGKANDGCAVFWKEELFTLLHQESIEFQKFGLRDNVAQLCVLKMIRSHSDSNQCVNSQNSQNTPSRSLLLVNIHVLFNPNRGDIKLGQVRLLLERAHAISQEWGNIPVVIAGDLNSMPKSPIYQFLASSSLDILLHDRRKISGQIENEISSRPLTAQLEDAHRWSEEELRLAAGCDGVTQLQHHLKLCSAYTGIPGSYRTRDNCGEPLATSYHSKFMGTVDYIWHSQGLVPVGVVETLPVDILRKIRGLPNEKWGSDHLALVCELAFVDDSRVT